MAINHSKTCPECGASNSADDLFCKDCGASLAAVGVVAEQTTTFRPVQSVEDTHTTTIVPAMDTGTTAVAPAIGPESAQQYGYPVEAQPTSVGSIPQQESPRGAVLGWLAATLFLVIVGFYLWSSVLSEATRDRFTGWF